MQRTGFRSLSLASTAIVWLTTLAATTALAVAAAYWTWAWFAPRPVPITEASSSSALRLDDAYQLFGNVRVARSTVPTAASSSLKLLGLVAASGHEPGYAVLKLGANRAIAVRQGGEIEPGTRLVEVNADHAVLDRGGVRETLALPRRGRDAATVSGHAR